MKIFENVNVILNKLLFNNYSIKIAVFRIRIDNN